ncbi:MAG: PDZ domain-containing protein [Planctomycetota bacterium]|nr:PDZ domain-containing protein [Planctomycetota bacterium]
MDKRIFISMLLVILLACPVLADENEQDEEKQIEPAEQVRIANIVSASLLRVEWTVKFDKGEAPPGGELAIRQERALEQTGFLLSPKIVLTGDIITHPRFIKRLFVSFGGRQVQAVPKAYMKDRRAMLLELSEPLKGAKPIVFAADAEEPYIAVHYGRYGTTLTKRLWPLKLSSVYVTETNRQYRAGPSDCLIVDKEGKAVGVSMGSEWPIDDSWKGSPLNWPAIQAEEMKKALADLEESTGKNLLRVTLNFRSPKKKTVRDYYDRRSEENQTEQNTTGVLTNKDEILVLSNMPPKITARLERITVHSSETAEPVNAKFKCTLKDYGGFIAALEKPLTGEVTLSIKDTRKYRNQLLLSAKIIIQGKKRVAYFSHNRITSYDLGWKRHMYPDVNWSDRDSFFFDIDGGLVAMPVARREKVSVKERWGSSDSLLTAAPYLSEVLADLDKNIDKANVPLTEEEESRLAWMGVELQGLNKELARINNVSDLTNDGQTGALVSYVYPGSPADKAGIKAGAVLLRIHAEDQPKPIDVQVESSGFAGRTFPWERLDQVPEQYYDQIPRPWPGRENFLTRALTDLGFGKKYKAEFFSDGKSVSKDFEVIVSPPHYDTAKRHKSEPLGLTVRNLTYELQRYFQKKPGDAGVIISKIEPGSKASVSGLKPYEIITHVNGKEIANVGEFEKLIADQVEMQLLVKRMTRGRTVKIKLPAATTKPAETTKPEG